MPGPPVVVCEGDTVVVDVMNKMPTQSFAMHWHGNNQTK